MAIATTSTGSNWVIWSGTDEEVVNTLMASGVGTLNVRGYSSFSVGSVSVLLSWK